MIIKKQIKQSNETASGAEKQSAAPVEQEKDEVIDLFDLDNIDFSQRSERRRGDRRRGYRRIDDRNLISRAHEESDTIKESAAKEGYNAGLEQAKSDIQKLKVAIDSFFGAKKEVYDSIAPDILEISVDIARKIVKREISQDPQILIDTIMDILKTVSKDENRIMIKVNPGQVELVKQMAPVLIESIGLDARLSVIPEESVDVGSCILYTSNGVVDASIETQLEIIKEALKGI